MIDFVSGWMDAGGPIVVILALLSIYSIALIAAKIVQLAGSGGDRAGWQDAVTRWREGAHEDGLRRLAGGRSPVERVLAAAMRRLASGAEPAAVREEVEHRGNSELAVLGRNLRTLEVIATTSPLLGLLGTVLGMIESFRELELAAGSANATVLAGGIWKALLTTAMGLLVAIPAAAAAGLILGRIERVRQSIEDAAHRLFAPGAEDAGR